MLYIKGNAEAPCEVSEKPKVHRAFFGGGRLVAGWHHMVFLYVVVSRGSLHPETGGRTRKWSNFLVNWNHHLFFWGVGGDFWKWNAKSRSWTWCFWSNLKGIIFWIHLGLYMVRSVEIHSNDQEVLRICAFLHSPFFPPISYIHTHHTPKNWGRCTCWAAWCFTWVE